MVALSAERFDLDWRIRLTAFAHLASLTAESGSVATTEELNRGFAFEGRPVRLWNPRAGIWRPREMPSAAALSVFTAPQRADRVPRYDDEIGSDGLFAYRYEGSDPRSPRNRAVRAAYEEQRPIIYIYGLVPGMYALIFPCFVVADDPANLTFTLAAQSSTDFIPGELDSGDLEVERRYATRTVKQRLHQEKFRLLVVSAYRTQCAMCRLRHRKLLDAAHILADKDKRGRAEVPNGLCLCKIHHAAFDANILGVDPTYVIHVRDDVLREVDGPMLRHGLQGLNKEHIVVPRGPLRKPNPDYLAERFERFRTA